jgi:hypothetical protein
MVRIGSLVRARLADSAFACPDLRKYPIANQSHVSSAKSYYQRPNTAKCPGGKKAICSRARVLGMLSAGAPQGESWRKWCGK